MSTPNRWAELAQKNIQDILNIAIGYSQPNVALIVADSDCKLAIYLAQAYQACLPGAKFIHFNLKSSQEILKALAALMPKDLVVLIQSTNFRLEAFRIRVELFNRSLKVIEHPHLASMKPDEIDTYIESLAYDPKYYRRVGPELKKSLDKARIGIVESGDAQLIFNSSFESAKLNVGDYSEIKNVGGQFPIGEVFTEAKNLEAVNGRARIFAFGDNSFQLNKPEKPITLVIEKGRVVEAIGSTSQFDQVLAQIRMDESEIWVRELGFGLNRAFTQEKTVSDIGTYERMCGVHLSLGAKHSLYKKPSFSRSFTKHHVDVFVATESVMLDQEIVYRDGAWQV